MAEKKEKLWGGRFRQETSRLMERFNSSLSFDRRMWREDIRGSMVYAEGLERAEIIAADELAAILDGLKKVSAEIESGEFVWNDSDEDIHMAVERRLTEIIGAVGGKLHTGRSRNDQVATDMRLWLLGFLKELDSDICTLLTAILNRAEEHKETILPGFTHLQQAQPISFAHYLMSFFWMLERDRSRFRQLVERVSVMPLGSGALAGNAIGIDRKFLAKKLGFAEVSDNSLDSVSDRDFVSEFMAHASICGSHLSRLAEDLIIYSSSGYRYVSLSDEFSTGSSLMPQKKNPDSMELVRGKAGRMIGNLTGFLATLKGLPSTYNKDLQEDKEPLFDTADTLTACIKISAGVIATLEVNSAVMESSLDDFLLATDLADYLVSRGLPFRKAHEVVGQVVLACENRGCSLKSLPLEVYSQVNEFFAEDLYDALDYSSSLAQRSVIGATGPEAVEQQLAKARKTI